MDVLQNVSVTVDELLRKSARRWPRRAALIDDTGVVDYQTLLQQVERAKEALKAAGVKPGHCIALMGRDGRAFVVSAFAAVGCGAVVMPTAPRLTHWELSRMLDSASVHAILDDGTGVLPASWRFHRIPIGSDLQVRLGWREHQPVGSVKDLVPDAAFIRFTSGTTGASKGVVLSHKDVIERTAAANRGLGLGSRDTVLWVLPMAYHFFVSIVLYLRYGVTVVVCREHLARALLETANRHQATFLYASPLQYRWLVADESDTRFSHLCHAVSTSTRLDPRTAELFSQRYGLPVAQAYGIIEVGLPMVNLDGAATRPGSVGRAQPDFEVALFGEGGMGKLVCPCMGPAQLKPVPDGKVGQLAVRGPGMFSAYLNPPKLREEVLVD
ncbi:MAG: AMP-binding protein, partial [Phycisphaerae bacterium]